MGIRLMILYGRLHEGIHQTTKRSTSLKLMYIKTDHEACLGWVSSSFPLDIENHLSLEKLLEKESSLAVVFHLKSSH